MKCVYEALPRLCSFRYWLTSARFSSSTLTGTCRFDVAVGTVKLVSMFSTILSAPPRMGCASPRACGVAAGAWAGAASACAPGGAGAVAARRALAQQLHEVRAPGLVHQRGVAAVTTQQALHVGRVRAEALRDNLRQILSVKLFAQGLITST